MRLVRAISYFDNIFFFFLHVTVKRLLPCIQFTIGFKRKNVQDRCVLKIQRFYYFNITQMYRRTSYSTRLKCQCNMFWKRNAFTTTVRTFIVTRKLLQLIIVCCYYEFKSIPDSDFEINAHYTNHTNRYNFI